MGKRGNLAKEGLEYVLVGPLLAGCCLLRIRVLAGCVGTLGWHCLHDPRRETLELSLGVGL